MFAAALYAADEPISTVVSSFNTDKPVQRELLTNEGLVLLSEAGFSDSFIVEKIVLSRSHFDTSVEGLAFLRRKDISEELILFVLKHATQPAPPSSGSATANKPVTMPPSSPE